MSGSYLLPLTQYKTISFAAAFFAHAALFSIGGAVFSQPAEYGVETGTGGMEIQLIAAPADHSVPAADASPEPSADVVEKAEPAPAQPPVLAEKITGDGSSPVPGKDPTTLHSIGGAETQAKPHYFKNPAPHYPETARRSGQQGVVLILANVSEEGLAASVRVKKSSGYPVLDEAALNAVRRWKFKPAMIGSMTVHSRVEIPVRFQLDR